MGHVLDSLKSFLKGGDDIKKKHFIIFVLALILFNPVKVQAITDFGGWFDDKQPPSSYYSVASNVGAFKFLIDNNLETSYQYTYAETITMNNLIYFDKLKIRCNGSSSNNYPTLTFTYTDLTKQVITSQSLLNYDGFITLDSTKYLKSIKIENYVTVYELDLIKASDFYLNSISPSNGSVDNVLDTTIRCTFNKSIAQSGDIKVTDLNGNIVNGSITVVNSYAEFKPTTDLLYDTIYNVEVTGFKDSENNAVMKYVSSFKTVKDTRPILVKNIKPPPDSINVPIDTNVEIEFNKTNIDLNTLGNIRIDGVLTETSYFNGKVTLTIKQVLEFNNQYNIHIEGVKDTLGNGMVSPIDVKFTTVNDTSPLNLLSYKPPSGVYPLDMLFEFFFNKNINPSELQYTLKDSQGNNISCSMSVVGSKVTFFPTLQSSKTYTFTLISAKDMNGNVYDNPIIINFQTMKSSGQKDFDNITSTNLKLFSDVKDNGFDMVKIAIVVGILFIGALWLWRKTKYWSKKSE